MADETLIGDRDHVYLSTGCLHGGADFDSPGHVYCRTEARRYDGTTKRASSCKFCGAPCICTCHDTDVSSLNPGLG